MFGSGQWRQIQLIGTECDLLRPRGGHRTAPGGQDPSGAVRSAAALPWTTSSSTDSGPLIETENPHALRFRPPASPPLFSIQRSIETCIFRLPALGEKSPLRSSLPALSPPPLHAARSSSAAPGAPGRVPRQRHRHDGWGRRSPQGLHAVDLERLSGRRLAVHQGRGESPQLHRQHRSRTTGTRPSRTSRSRNGLPPVSRPPRFSCGRPAPPPQRTRSACFPRRHR